MTKLQDEILETMREIQTNLANKGKNYGIHDYAYSLTTLLERKITEARIQEVEWCRDCSYLQSKKVLERIVELQKGLNDK